MWHPRERADLLTALHDAGPGAPTLCEGWRTEHLAAHLVLREGTVLTAAGIAVPPLAGRTERRTQELGARSTTPAAWRSLLDRLESGPPRWHPLRWAGDGPQLAELFVHTEDVRRATEGAATAPRRVDPAHADALWRAVGQASRLLLRRCPVPVVLRRADDPAASVTAGPAPSGRPSTEASTGPGTGAGTDPVTVTGDPGELLLWAFDRSRVARVTVTGPASATARLADFRPPPP